MVTYSILGCNSIKPTPIDNSPIPITDNISGIGQDVECIELLIRQLDNDEWEMREKAQGELIEVGTKLILEYKKVVFATEAQRINSKEKIKAFANALKKECSSTDAEIKIRAKKVYQYFHFLTKPGILFSAKNDDESELYIIDTEEGGIRKLTENNGGNLFPAWSPNGDKIVFNSTRDDIFSIYIMDIMQKKQIRLVKNIEHCFWPKWNPDGNMILFKSGVDIFVINTNGENMKNLTKNQYKAGRSAWSPDGTKIVFCSTLLPEKEIYVINLLDNNITNIKKLTNGEHPVWCPDGTKISFELSHNDMTEFYVIDANGNNMKKIAENKTYLRCETIAWAPNGNKIAFALNKKDISEIYTADANGENKKKLTENKNQVIDIVWNPDGTKIAFESKKMANSTILHLIDANGKNHRILTEYKSNSELPGWNPLSFPEISVLFEDISITDNKQDK